MAEIIKLARAADDLAEIWDYIADDSEAQADLFVDEIDSPGGRFANGNCNC